MSKDKQNEPEQDSKQDSPSAEQAHDEPAQSETGSGSDEASSKDSGENSTEDLQTQLNKAKLVIAEHAEQLLRARAETENMRKRHAKEIEQARAYAMESFVVEVLAVKDSLETGLENMSGAGEDGGQQDLEKMQEGVELTLQVLQKIFEKFGISELDPQGAAFDPDYHQAMMTEASAEHAPGTVLKVIQKGYLLKGRLVRPALVSVAGDEEPAH